MLITWRNTARLRESWDVPNKIAPNDCTVRVPPRVVRCYGGLQAAGLESPSRVRESPCEQSLVCWPLSGEAVCTAWMG